MGKKLVVSTNQDNTKPTSKQQDCLDETNVIHCTSLIKAHRNKPRVYHHNLLLVNTLQTI